MTLVICHNTVDAQDETLSRTEMKTARMVRMVSARGIWGGVGGKKRPQVMSLRL